MRFHKRVALFVVCTFSIPLGLFAQSVDICSKLPTVDPIRTVSSPGGGAPSTTNSDVVVQQMRERAETQARLDKERANWVVQMVPVKYLDSATSLKAICIFPSEIVPQSAQHLISVRAPATSMAAIVDAIKRMDVPQQGARNVEWTINVLVASDQTETLRPVPASLTAVVDQVKGVLPYKQFYLLEIMFGTTADGHAININGGVRGLRPVPPPPAVLRDDSYYLTSNLRVGGGEPPTVRLSELNFRLSTDNSQVTIATDVDIPAGKQVVVGKSTSGDRAYILVVSAKILN